MSRTFRSGDDDETGLTLRQRRKVQRLRMLATYAEPRVLDQIDDAAEAERIVRGMLGRGQ